MMACPHLGRGARTTTVMRFASGPRVPQTNDLSVVPNLGADNLVKVSDRAPPLGRCMRGGGGGTVCTLRMADSDDIKGGDGSGSRFNAKSLTALGGGRWTTWLAPRQVTGIML